MYKHFVLCQYCDVTPEGRNSEARGTSIVRQRLGKHVTAEMSAHATIEVLPVLCNCEVNRPLQQ
jgi:predicted metal-binding protein